MASVVQKQTQPKTSTKLQSTASRERGKPKQSQDQTMHRFSSLECSCGQFTERHRRVSIAHSAMGTGQTRRLR